MTAALERIKSAGVTLNPDKYEFGKTRLKFLGHIVDEDSICADLDKTSAITQMSSTMTISEIQQFMGMVNQLGKFTPKLAELTQPLRELLSKSGTWVWAPAQERAFAQVKEELSKPTVLALYDPEGSPYENICRCLLVWTWCSTAAGT